MPNDLTKDELWLIGFMRAYGPNATFRVFKHKTRDAELGKIIRCEVSIVEINQDKLSPKPEDMT